MTEQEIKRIKAVVLVGNISLGIITMAVLLAFLVEDPIFSLSDQIFQNNERFSRGTIHLVKARKEIFSGFLIGTIVSVNIQSRTLVIRGVDGMLTTVFVPKDVPIRIHKIKRPLILEHEILRWDKEREWLKYEKEMLITP